MLRLSDAAAPQDLAWLGLDADSRTYLADRAAHHERAAARLREAGRLYPCFETADELRWKREQRVRRHLPPVYDRAMLKLTTAQRDAAEAGGKRPYWRFRLSDAEIAWRDRVAGPLAVKLTAVSDPVVVAEDGTVSTIFAGAIDDVDEAIGFVVREANQIESSAIHLDLVAALGGRTDRLGLAHLPALPEKLARMPIRRLRQDGVEPSSVVTWLAGHAHAAPAELAGLIAGFDLVAAGRGARTLDLDRLRALNRAALAAMPYSAVAERLPSGADERFWLAVRGGIDLLGEARHWWDVVSDRFVPPVLDGAAPILAAATGAMPPEPWDETSWERWTRDHIDTKTLRLALTGEEMGPAMAGLLPLIGRARAMERLRPA